MHDLTPKLIDNMTYIIKKIKAKSFPKIKSVFVKIFHGEKNRIYTLLLVPYQEGTAGVEIYPLDAGLKTFIDEQTNLYFDGAEHETISCIADFNYKPFQLLCNFNRQAASSNNIPKLWLKDLEFITDLLIHDLNSRKSIICAEDKVFLVCDDIEKQYELFKITEIPYSYNYPLKRINYQLLDELKQLDKKTIDYVFYMTYFLTEEKPDAYKVFLGYGKKTELFADFLITDKLSLEQIWSFLISMFQKYGLPTKLEINNPEIFCSMINTLIAAGVNTKYNRYDLMQNYYARDLLQFAKAYFLKYEYEATDFNRYMHKALNILQGFLIDGYNPETQKLAEALLEYTDIVENSEDKNEDTLVS